ncbi:uncharacterized protein LOC143586321 isoform X2 [Bidens hawaiensis]|uniref:uncharacterized protein LOC143586321 isoform X2 n=1 Tax=Bidens hawaiensis TaxID=980011 RepID=UPI0040495F16
MEESKFTKKLLVLDVNGLLVDIVADPDEGYKPDTIIGSKAVFKRPFCDEFLKFCFERFNVGVWTSRTRRNIEQVLKFLEINSQDQLLFCWDQFHCTKTGFNTIENSGKPLVLKELKKLWEKQDSNLPEKGVYNESNTIFLDDSPYKALRNPPHTAIFPYSYSYRDTQDNGLGPNGDLRNYLEKLAACDDVQKFIEHNPFGQQPITYDDESWYFYRKIIGSIEPKADPTRSRRKLIILDTGGLLVDIASAPREGFKADTMQGSTSVFKRPYCDEFLQFCFKRFNVGVWTSTSRYTTEWTLDYVMGDSQHKLVFCWDRSHCTDTGFSTVENTSKVLILKQLKNIWEKKDVDLPWDKGEFDETNTLLIDNTPHKALLNPPHTAIFPHRYRYFNSEDNSLGPKGDLRVYLERLAESENVQKFVSENLFAQRPIREMNLSWRYYQKVIHAISSRLNRANGSFDARSINISAPKLNPATGLVAPTLVETNAVSTAVSDAPTLSEPKVVSTTVLAATKCLEPETDAVMADAQTSSEPETNTATDLTDQASLESETNTTTVLTGQTSLEPESDHTTVLTCQTSLEPETNNNTVLAAPHCLEEESDTSVLAAQTSLGPETETATVLIGQTSLEQKTDTATVLIGQTSLEQETGTIMADAQKTSLEPKTDTATVLTDQTLLESEADTAIVLTGQTLLESETDTATFLTGQTSLEPESDHSTVLTGQMSLEPETENTTVLAATNCLEAETDTSVLVVQTSLEPEIETTNALTGQTSLEPETDTTMTDAQTSLEQETDTTVLAAQTLLEPETDTTTDLTGQTSLESGIDTATVLTGQISLEPETDHTTVMTGQTPLEPETENTTVLAAPNCLEAETDTSVLVVQTSLEPETDTTMTDAQTSLEQETDATTDLTGQASLIPETDTTTVLATRTSLEPETNTTVLTTQTLLEPETDTTSVLTGQTSLEPETDATTVLTGQNC